jgi:hypothetical protein
MREDMKASSVLGSVILVLILMGAPLLVIPVHASAILPIITCWDGSTIGPVNGTYVVHSSPTPICPHGQSPMQDRTCLPPCGGSNIAEEFMYKTTKFTDYVFNAGQTICDNRVSNVMPTLYNDQTKQQQFCSGYKVGSTNSAKYDSQGGIICDNENNTGCHWDITNVKV